MDMNSQTRIVVAVVAGPLVLYAIYYFLKSKSSKPNFLNEKTIDFDVSTDFGTFFNFSIKTQDLIETNT